MDIQGHFEQVPVEEPVQGNHLRFFQDQVVAVKVGIVSIAAFVLFRAVGIYLRNQRQVNTVKQVAVFRFK